MAKKLVFGTYASLHHPVVLAIFKFRYDGLKFTGLDKIEN
jgi:hypothetical protein